MKTVTCIDIEKNAYEVPIDILQWRPSLYAIIIREDVILLSPQWDGYDLPGGGMNLGETLQETLTREVKEETGIDIIPGEVVHVSSSFFKLPHSEKEFVQSILIYFTAQANHGELSVEGFDEHEKGYARLAEWIPLSELQSIKWTSSIDLYPIISKALTHRVKIS